MRFVASKFLRQIVEISSARSRALVVKHVAVHAAYVHFRGEKPPKVMGVFASHIYVRTA